MRKPLFLMSIGGGVAMMAAIAAILLSALIITAQNDENDSGSNTTEPSAPVSSNPAQETDASTWTAYLTDDERGSLLAVAPDGTLTEYDLDLPAGAYVNERDMTITPEGLVAFCGVIYPGEGSTALPSAFVRVRDLASGTNQLDIDLGNYTSCNAGTIGIGPNGEDVLAVSVLRSFGRPGAAESDGPAWRMDLMDMTTGETVASLGKDDPAANTIEFGDLYGPVDRATLPIILIPTSVRADAVRFFPIIAAGDGGPFEIPVFEWNPQTGAVSATGFDQTFNSAVDAATGRVARPAVDESIPQVETMGIGARYNAVTLIDEAGNLRTIYQTSEQLVGEVSFANGGTAVAVSLVNPLPMDAQPPAQAPGFDVILIDLNGNLLGEIGTYPGYPRLLSAPDGLLVFDQLNTPDGVLTFTLTHHASDGTERVIWEAARNTSGNPGPMHFWNPVTVIAG